MYVQPEHISQTFERYASRLCNRMTAVVRNRAVAEDITAAAFAKAFEKRGSFRGAPITLRFARQVGGIMAEVGEGVTPHPSYRFYM